MSSLRQALRSRLPGPVLSVWRAIRDGGTRLPARLAWELDPTRCRNARRMRRFRGRHRGERCFIIGNGPSLVRTDLSRLRHEVTFGLNRIYLLFPQMGFSTTYHVAVNELVLRQFRDEICELPMPKFVSWFARDVMPDRADVVFVREPRDGTFRFTRRPSLWVWEGATVTYVALQLAFYMGFRQVILVGVDHRFSTHGTPHETVTSRSYDSNHFDPNYFGPGVRWQLPDLQTSERAYGLAREAYAGAGRQVLDATVDGALQVFPKVAFGSLF